MVHNKVEPNIVIGMCTGGSIRAETVRSLISNIINVAQTGLMPNILFQVGGYVDVNRNKIVQTSLEQGATHIIFIDADMIFPDDGIMRLLEHDKDVVGANYNIRLSPTSVDLSGPTVKMLVDGEAVSMINEDFPTELFKCYALGTGFMMINTRIFDKLEAPYFEAFQDKQGRHHTEDIEFCKRVNDAGFEVYCDPTIKMGHIGEYVY